MSEEMSNGNDDSKRMWMSYEVDSDLVNWPKHDLLILMVIDELPTPSDEHGSSKSRVLKLYEKGKVVFDDRTC